VIRRLVWRRWRLVDIWMIAVTSSLARRTREQEIWRRIATISILMNVSHNYICLFISGYYLFTVVLFDHLLFIVFFAYTVEVYATIHFMFFSTNLHHNWMLHYIQLYANNKWLESWICIELLCITLYIILSIFHCFDTVGQMTWRHCFVRSMAGRLLSVAAEQCYCQTNDAAL